MIRLRPHHLLCILTYAGEGYTPEFVANFSAVVERIGAGEPIVVADGPDDLCAPLDGTGDVHCRGDDARDGDRTALLALADGPLLGCNVRALVVDAALLARLRAHFADGTIRGACHGCSWASLCTATAANGFAGAQLGA